VAQDDLSTNDIRLVEEEHSTGAIGKHEYPQGRREAYTQTPNPIATDDRAKSRAVIVLNPG
jgi:hypothetical protein